MASIMILGVGGIGGLVATPLAKAYPADVSLVERGPRRESIQRDGLVLHSDAWGEMAVTPQVVQESPEGLDPQDLIFICVKNTALEPAAESMASVVGPNTTIVPLMNGVRAYPYLQERFPEAVVLPAVIYTVSYVQDDQSIVQKGKFTNIRLGALGETQREIQAVESVSNLLNEAGIECHESDDVLSTVWQKYILNCAYNVMDTFHDCTVGDIKADKAKIADYTALLSEAEAVARARGVDVPRDIVRKQVFALMHTTDDSTSSLHRDFMAGRSGELEIFSGDIVRMARESGVDAPVSVRYYEGLLERARFFG